MSIEEPALAARHPGSPAARGGPEPPAGADLLAAADHDVAAFEAVYRRHVRRVTGFAASRCASAEDVADVVVQTFIRLLTAAGSYDPTRGDPAAYVLGISPGAARTRLSRARRRVRDLMTTTDQERER